MRIIIISIAIVLVPVLVIMFFLIPSFPPAREGIVYVTTIHPAAAILEEVVGERAKVVRLLSPGKSPHTYEPNPSDREAVECATAVIYVGRNLDDWVARFPAGKKIELLTLVPREYILFMTPHHDYHGGDEEHERSERITDPHFWTDPLVVKAMLVNLVPVLCELDPDGAETYRSNAERFAAELDALHNELTVMLAPVKGRPVFLFHPSLRYFLKRYGLELAGVIEPFPGKEAPPGYLEKVKNMVQRRGAKVVFTEPQLSPRPAEVVAGEAGVKVRILDPLGGVEGRRTYADLIRYNARVFLEALR